MDEPGLYCQVFGDTPRNRIVEFFLEMRDTDFGIADVARNLEMNKATAYNNAEELIGEGILVEARRIGRTQTYKLNRKSEKVKVMLRAFDELLRKQVLFAEH